jgi:hypothetical protein
LLEKLIGVNREKEPFDGTGPDRLLLDRSRTWRVLMLVSELGIEPERLLLFSRRKRNFSKFPRESGIVPFNSLRYKSKLTKFVRLPSSLGIVPLMLLLYISKYCRFFNCPSCETNEPDNCAFPRSTLITKLLLSQVTWNQVQGLTRVLSQLCKTFAGSFKLVFKAYKASPSVFAQVLGSEKRRRHRESAEKKRQEHREWNWNWNRKRSSFISMCR